MRASRSCPLRNASAAIFAPLLIKCLHICGDLTDLFAAQKSFAWLSHAFTSGGLDRLGPHADRAAATNSAAPRRKAMTHPHADSARPAYIFSRQVPTANPVATIRLTILTHIGTWVPAMAIFHAR